MSVNLDQGKLVILILGCSVWIMGLELTMESIPCSEVKSGSLNFWGGPVELSAGSRYPELFFIGDQQPKLAAAQL